MVMDEVMDRVVETQLNIYNTIATEALFSW